MKLTWTHLALFVFGILYNQLVAWIEKKRYHYGIISLLVVGGCGITILASIREIGTEAAWEVFKCFAFSGLWMVIGSLWRYAKGERRDTNLTKETLSEFLAWRGDGDTARGGEEEMEQDSLDGTV